MTLPGVGFYLTECWFLSSSFFQVLGSPQINDLTFASMKNPITDDPDQHLSHTTFFAKLAHALKNHVIATPTMSSQPNALPEHTEKSYVEVVCVKHSSLLINETTSLDLVHPQSVLSFCS